MSVDLMESELTLPTTSSSSSSATQIQSSSRKRKQPSTSGDAASAAAPAASLDLGEHVSIDHIAPDVPLKKSRLEQPPLMNLVTRDADALSVVLLLLSWKDLSSLYATCHSWRKHLSFTRRIICSVNNQLELLPNQYLIAQHADWITAHVSKLRVTEETWAQCENRFSEGLYGRRPASDLELELNGLSRFRELKIIELCLPSMSFTQVIFNILGQLNLLRSVSIVWEEDHLPKTTKVEKARSISFAPLRQLAHLEDFVFSPCGDYHCTKEQMMDIVGMQALKTLRCGLMVGRHAAQSDNDRTREQWLSECAALLPRLPHLEEISEPVGVIHVDGWVQLSQCQSLNRLSFRWPDAMLDEWSRLTNLRATLREFCYEPEDYSSVRNEPALLRALAECTQLERVKFDTVNFPQAELEHLLTQLTTLQKLGFRHCRFESLAPFGKAPESLKELDFFQCLDMERERFDWDKGLPPMAGVSKLFIVELRNNRFVVHSARASKKLAEHMVRKMPKLTLDNIFVYILETVYNGGVDTSDDI